MTGESRAGDPVRDLFDALDRRDAAALRLLLHPYLHWTEDGTTICGRKNVLARLQDSNRLPAPRSIELRDDQVYRWEA